MEDKLCDAPNLMTFLKTTPRELIEEYSIVAHLNLDLRGFKYSAPASAVDEGKRGSVGRVSPRLSSPRKGTASTSVERQEKQKRSLRERSPSSPSTPSVDVREGKIDKKTGERLYYIEKIIKYEPGRGYYVHWKGYTKADRTWQDEKDMPKCWAKKMKASRERYKESLNVSTFSHS